MQPSAIRRSVLGDHEKIRGMLVSIEKLAGGVSRGEERLLGALRLEGEALLVLLREHMQWEDRYLRPALLAADAWGEERASHLDADHREQRELLEHSLERVREPGRPGSLLAGNLLDLVGLLRADMEEEETLLLDERVLRDDVVGIDVETG